MYAKLLVSLCGNGGIDCASDILIWEQQSLWIIVVNLCSLLVCPFLWNTGKSFDYN